MRTWAVLLRKDCRVAANLWRQALLQSRFKQIFIGLFAVGLLAGLWRLFLNGFRFLSTLGGVGTLVIHRLFGLFFFSLAVMLLVSSVITAFAVLFRARENPFLTLSPMSHGERVVHQWLEVTLISSWAFFFMIVPFVGAFVMHEQLPLPLLFWTALLSLPFVLLCCGLGMLLALAGVRWLPRFRPVVFGITLAALLGWWWWRSAAAAAPVRPDDAMLMLSRLVPGLRLAAFPLWPSRWVAEGIMALSRGNWWRGGWLTAVLLSHVLLVGLLLKNRGDRWFYEAWQRTLRPRRRALRRRMWRGPDLMFLLPQDWRALIVKDWLMLLRDPLQWTQGAVFFCLLAVYFLNLRNLNYHLLDPVWRNLIAFTNVFSLGAIMCSFCSRFIYPQMSLEGHGCWLLGLSPVGMGRVLLVKFVGALAGLVLISAGLLLVSGAMLDADPGIRWITLLLAAALPAGLCALAMGLGAIFMNLKQTNPTVIISGFGGTLNLAFSLGYMIAAVMPFAVIHHWYYTGRLTAAGLSRGIPPAVGWLLVLTAITVALPLMLGRRALVRREY